MATDKKRSHPAPARSATAPAETTGATTDAKTEQAQARAAADAVSEPRRNPRAAATPVFVAPRTRAPLEGQSEATLHVTPRRRPRGAATDSTPAAED